MSSSDYQVGDRRPLASRTWRISERVAEWLARRGATPNVISVVGMFCGIFAGIALALTAWTSDWQWLCWLAGALFVQLRLLANLFDGMVAVLRKIASPLGELFNEVPDRVSDAATLIGLGYAAGSNVPLGFIAACIAIFLAYVRAQGKVVGAHQEFCGPMAKQQRMATVTISVVLCASFPRLVSLGLAKWALLVIIAGGLITVVRRLHRIAAALRR